MRRDLTPLAAAVSRDTGVSAEQILLLRHASGNVRELLRTGGTVEEYTALQPIGSRYDFLDPARRPVRVVVVVVYGAVYDVYEVVGVEREGWTHNLASPPHRAFDQARDRDNRRARLFHLVPLPSRVVGQPVHGWDRRARIPVQRWGDAFFHEITVRVPDTARPDVAAELRADLEEIDSTDAPETTRAALAQARVGQGRFRRGLMVLWGGACAVTGCDLPEALRASHCKPWRESTDSERLDPANGLLLVATLDALFDAGVITFSDAGRMLVDASVSREQVEALCLQPASLRAVLTPRQRYFLRYHRAHVYLGAQSDTQPPIADPREASRSL